MAEPALQALNALDNWSFYPFAGGIAAFVLPSGVGLVGARRFFPSWLGWAALVIGVLGLLPFTSFPAFLLAGVWILVASLMLFTRWEAVRRLADQSAVSPGAAGPSWENARPPRAR